MSSISATDFLLWKEKQLSKGGDNESLDLLIELIGGINRNDINLCKINSDRTLYLKKKIKRNRIYMGRFSIKFSSDSIFMWIRLLERYQTFSF